MNTFAITLDPAAAAFYRQLAKRLGRPMEQVLADALFKLAGELSLEALHRKKRKNPAESIDFSP